jgi:hypothetical protein
LQLVALGPGSTLRIKQEKGFSQAQTIQQHQTRPPAVSDRALAGQSLVRWPGLPEPAYQTRPNYPEPPPGRQISRVTEPPPNLPTRRPPPRLQPTIASPLASPSLSHGAGAREAPVPGASLACPWSATLTAFPIRRGQAPKQGGKFSVVGGLLEPTSVLDHRHNPKPEPESAQRAVGGGGAVCVRRGDDDVAVEEEEDCGTRGRRGRRPRQRRAEQGSRQPLPSIDSPSRCRLHSAAAWIRAERSAADHRARFAAFNAHWSKLQPQGASPGRRGGCTCSWRSGRPTSSGAGRCPGSARA